MIHKDEAKSPGQEIIRLLYIVAGEAEAVSIDAVAPQEQFNPETYEITAWRYNRLHKALAELDAAEEAERNLLSVPVVGK